MNNNTCKTTFMIIAYLYERPYEEGAAMGAERTFADYPPTRRSELNSMIQQKGLREGDTLRIRAVSDLGRGQESKRIQQMISDMGVTLEVLPSEANKKLRGRPQKAEVRTIQQYDQLCGLWFSPIPFDVCFDRGEEITGAKVDKSWFDYRCGPRHGRKAAEKRAAMVKKLNKDEGPNRGREK